MAANVRALLRVDAPGPRQAMETIPGIYPADLDEEGAHAIGRAYVEQFEPKEIAIGRDMRVSSTSMAKAPASSNLVMVSRQGVAL